MQVHEYTWIFGVTMVVAFLDAYGIGANDVANSFATSVSSGSLSLAQACIVACFTEFLGAFLLGSQTAETIKGGIIDVHRFADDPGLLMLAMMCALIGSATWVLFATRHGWPVSTTHSIVGAVIGVGIAAFGGEAVDWGWTGVAQIITSWFISPIIAGVVAAILYTLTKYAVLRQVESFKWGIRLVPVYFFVTTTIDAFYIIYKGAPGTSAANMSVGAIVGIAFGVGAAFALFALCFFCPWAVRRIKGREDLRWYHVFVIPFLSPRPTLQQVDPEHHASHGVPRGDSKSSPPPSPPLPPSSPQATGKETEKNKHTAEPATEIVTDESLRSPSSADDTPVHTSLSEIVKKYGKRAVDFALRGIRKDVRNLNNERLRSVHAAAELYEDEVEYLFSFLQVLTACMASFAHGSNDVANAVGPLSSVFGIWETGQVDVSGKVPVPIWILAYGGVAIDIGLATMGYKIMRSLGNNITYFSPSRGFCAELSAALTVLTCSKLGLPVSTTHCITGATAAVGLCNGSLKAVNWKMLAWCIFSWVLTLPFAGLTAGLLFAFASRSPKLGT